jgi:hypothetical protein
MWEQYRYLIEVAEQTVQNLGKNQACQFAELANDWIDLEDAIRQAYPKEELFRSLVHHDFVELFKEARWFGLLVLCGNYPMVYRNLRYAWEMMFRAYYADTYAQHFPSETDHLGLSADDKAALLVLQQVVCV